MEDLTSMSHEHIHIRDQDTTFIPKS